MKVTHKGNLDELTAFSAELLAVLIVKIVYEVIAYSIWMFGLELIEHILIEVLLVELVLVAETKLESTECLVTQQLVREHWQNGVSNLLVNDTRANRRMVSSKRLNDGSAKKNDSLLDGEVYNSGLKDSSYDMCGTFAEVASDA